MARRFNFVVAVGFFLVFKWSTLKAEDARDSVAAVVSLKQKSSSSAPRNAPLRTGR
jgi:hypothetical protein